MSELMDIITDCENHLGCYLDVRGTSKWKVRAALHRRMTITMEQAGWHERDVRLAFNYVQRNRKMIHSPMELLTYVRVAREHESSVAIEDPVGERINEAIAIEYMDGGPESAQWLDRLTRALGTFRTEVLAEWEAARARQPQ